MSDDRLIEKLAVHVLGWRPAVGRFLKPGRSWLPKSRFNPCSRLEHAFFLLDRSGGTYTLSVDEHGAFTAEVRIGGRVGKVSGKPKARAITLAIAKALNLESIN